MKRHKLLSGQSCLIVAVNEASLLDSILKSLMKEFFNCLCITASSDTFFVLKHGDGIGIHHICDYHVQENC